MSMPRPTRIFSRNTSRVAVQSRARSEHGRRMLILASALFFAAGIAIAALLAATGSADAACVCRCADGKAKAVCSSATDIPPLCNATSCPLSTPKRTPTDVSKPKPPVRPGCTVQQVYDPKTGKHEWGQICH